MQYHNITKDDMLNGDGLRVVLWVAGCSHGCRECHNPVTWDPDGGLPFEEETKQELFEQLEETMIMSDMGVETSVQICEELRKRIKERGITDPSVIMELIQEIVAEMMGDDIELDLSSKPSVIMVIGVNGAGKTTTIGKMCHQSVSYTHLTLPTT